MHIMILNRREAITLCNNDAVSDRNIALISISTPDTQYTDYPAIGGPIKAMLELSFYDSGGRDMQDLPCISSKQAEQAAKFIQEQADAGRDFIVHCDGGMSRSAGVAEAIAIYYNQPVPFAPRTTYPNAICKYQILKALRNLNKTPDQKGT